MNDNSTAKIKYDNSINFDKLTGADQNQAGENEIDGKQGKPVDEKIDFNVSKDNLLAYVSFSPALNGGAELSEGEIRSFLDNKGVVNGLDEAQIKALALDRQYHEKYLIAQGTPPIRGSDGYLVYLFDTEKKDRKPQLAEDGSTDYHSLELFEMAEPGQVLVRVVKSTPGVDGINIYGRRIPCRNGKAAPKLIKGRNLSLSEDGTELVSEINGQIVHYGHRVSVSEVIEFREDIGPATGDIIFPGSVKIYGNVLTDYKVNADGNIEVFGSVEGAELDASGSIMITQGVHGVNKGQLSASGNITAKFISDTMVTAGGNIYSDSIIRCTVKCDGNVTLNGPKGVLAGGISIVGDTVKARIIGSPMSARTELYVGLNPEKFEQYQAYIKKLKKLKGEYDTISKTMTSIVNAEKSGKLAESKKGVYAGAEVSRQFIRSNIHAVEEKIKALLPYLRQTKGVIEVSGVVYPGVKIQLGNAVMFVMDEIHNSSFYNKDGVVTIQEQV